MGTAITTKRTTPTTRVTNVSPGDTCGSPGPRPARWSTTALHHLRRPVPMNGTLWPILWPNRRRRLRQSQPLPHLRTNLTNQRIEIALCVHVDVDVLFRQQVPVVKVLGGVDVLHRLAG